MRTEVPIGSVRASAYTIPTDTPEADGTFTWNETTTVSVEVEARRDTGSTIPVPRRPRRGSF